MRYSGRFSRSSRLSRSANRFTPTRIATNAAQTTTGGSSAASTDTSAALGLEQRECDGVAQRRHAGEQPDQAVDAQPHPALRRHPELHRAEEVLVELHGLLVAAGRLDRLLHEPPALLD